jgi:hypothetical protein
MKLAAIVEEFQGKKILSGGTTGDIVARELKGKSGIHSNSMIPICRLYHIWKESTW